MFGCNRKRVGHSKKQFLKRTVGSLFLAGSFLVQAQSGPVGGFSPSLNHALLDVLGDGQSFHARATVQSSGSSGFPASYEIAVLGRNLRLEAESMEVGTNMPADEASRVRQMHSISIVRLDRNRTYLVFPAVRAYVEMLYTGSNNLAPPKVLITPGGKDMVGEESCLRNHWSISENDGRQFEITCWNSKNWSDFPIRIQIDNPALKVDFQDLHLEAPDPGLFEPPAGYTRYEGIQEALQRNAARSQNDAAP